MICMQPATKHRPDHTPKDDPCTLCKLPASQHKKRAPPPPIALTPPRAPRTRIDRAYEKSRNAFTIAIDGEGYTDETGRHRYTYMAAGSAEKFYGDVENLNGLTTKEIFDFLLELPNEPIKVGFSIGYDQTKWFDSLPNSTIYLLNHPELRPGDHGPRPVYWKEYQIQKLSTRFAVSRVVLRHRQSVKKRAIVWDLFKFFGKAFVGALEDWGVGTKEEVAKIAAMKEKRGNFAAISAEEKAYCQSEVRLMAILADTLLKAHAEADLELKQYYGPGSTASVMLKRMGAKELRAQLPDAMVPLAECAFFGGRFETSAAGPVRRVHGADIASAYPYIMTQLPCIAHGKWTLERGTGLGRIIRDAPAACVHYRLRHQDHIQYLPDHVFKADRVRTSVKADGRATTTPWGPFPFRLPDGNILYPVESAGGWVWRDEYLSGKQYWPNVEAVEAWVFRPTCSCDPPFASQIAEYFNLRLNWGKEGRGIAIKLGSNSCYGKLAQRLGAAPFHCTTLSGMITAGCRAMQLDAIGAAEDRWDILSVATDGIQSRVPLDLDDPQPTGTAQTARQVTDRSRLKAEAEGKTTYKQYYPLGAWERKASSTQHLIRPGMRFCPDAEAKRAETAARGIGVRVIHDNRQKILEAWKTAPMTDVYLQQPSQFMGSKGCVRVSKEGLDLWAAIRKGAQRPTSDQLNAFEQTVTRDAKYGNWITPVPRVVSYNPTPKRPYCDTTDHYRLMTWALSDDQGESRMYRGNDKSHLGEDAREMQEIESEQPDQGGFHVV